MLIAQRVRCDDTLCPDFAANCGDERPKEVKAQISHVRPQKNRGDLFRSIQIDRDPDTGAVQGKHMCEQELDHT